MAGAKDQWNRVFDSIMDMQDSFTEYLPEEVPTLPGFTFAPVFVLSPKDFMKQVKEFQTMAKDHFVEQADSVVDFCMKGQEKAMEALDKAVENAKEEKAEAAKDDASAEQPAE